jgi:hypothetical protein
LLGFEPDSPQVYTVHAPLSTPLIVSSIITYYFRTTFDFDGSTNGLTLFATNLVDDGCVIYLNGLEAGRLRVAPGQNANTLAATGTEGQLEELYLNSIARLLPGKNLLAVEVHQSSSTSADVMWGMKLMASQATPLVITNQPRDQIATVGDGVIFEVGVSGGPAYYQWQKNGVNIPGATGSSYTIAGIPLAGAGEYRVVVSNAVSLVTSDPAVLSVFVDSTGPRLVSAVVRDAGETNQIIITFSELVQSGFVANSTSTNIANYRITRCNSSDEVMITRASHGGSRVQLTVGGLNWVYRDCYQLTANNVTDLFGNRIAPDSRVALEWPVHVNLMDADASWNFHASAIFDGGVYDEDWTATDYLESLWWAQGSGVFYGGPVSASSCLGPLETTTGYQPEPVLFRTTFQWPTGFGNTAQLRPTFLADDGMVLYLNGTEIHRHNMSSGSGPVAADTRSAVTVSTAVCSSNVVAVTNLLPGQNWFAAAVVQAASGNQDMIFGLTLSASTTISEPLPEAPIPALHLDPEGTNTIRLWWTTSGYALESATNLTDNVESYPNGPWQEVPFMSNPYTNSLSNPTRFFRLKK